MIGKKSQRDEMKALNVEQANSEPLSLYSEKDEVADMEKKQISFWMNNQQFKRSKDFIKMSKSKLEKKMDKLSIRKRLESESTNIRRQLDKCKKELSRRDYQFG
ncbi:UPF0310 protein [Dirofilaria immitis]